MAGRAICRNCDREMAIMQDGMCGGCFSRAKSFEGGARQTALALARKDFMGKGPRCVGNRAPRVKSAIPSSSETKKLSPEKFAKIKQHIKNLGGKHTPAIDHDTKQGITIFRPLPASDDQYQKPQEFVYLPVDSNTIVLHFDDGDEALLEKLKATAKRFRREPSKQILWMLQYGLKYLDEFEARHVPDLSGVTK